MKTFRNFLVTACMLAASAGALAQAYPNKPIRYVIGYPAGSSIDVVSRIVLDDVRARTGSTIVIENRAGALGAIGIEAVARAAPDGYTLMPSSSATHSSGPHLSRALQKLEPVSSLSHVARMVRFDIAVVTSSAGPYKTAKALIDAGKAKPDALAYGYGSGTGQVSGAGFSHAAGIKARGIPYKGQPAAITDLLGGQVDFVASDLGAVLSFVKQGTLTAIALLADQRSSVLPNVPTAREVGLPNLGLVGWIGIDGPAKMPQEVTNWWAEQLKLSLASAAVQEKLRNIAMEPAGLYGDAFTQFVNTEYDRWGGYVRTAGIQPE
jgi:tripartite-type tricarboxylate transporter receptor subunit TctC